MKNQKCENGKSIRREHPKKLCKGLTENTSECRSNILIFFYGPMLAKTKKKKNILKMEKLITTRVAWGYRRQLPAARRKTRISDNMNGQQFCRCSHAELKPRAKEDKMLLERLRPNITYANRFIFFRAHCTCIYTCYFAKISDLRIFKTLPQPFSFNVNQTLWQVW